MSAGGARQHGGYQHDLLAGSGVLVDLAYGIFDRFMPKIFWFHMAAWHRSIVTFFVRCGNGDKDPFTGFHSLFDVTDFDTAAGTRVNIVARDLVFFSKYFSTIKSKFSQTDKTNFFHERSFRSII